MESWVIVWQAKALLCSKEWIREVSVFSFYMGSLHGFEDVFSQLAEDPGYQIAFIVAEADTIAL